jgi:phosphoglycolate phosphatase
MKTRRFDHIIFDLDGTLIDSAPPILACFDRLLFEWGVSRKVELDVDLIGLPLIETIARITGEKNLTVLQEMSESFKNDYDQNGVFDTSLYPDVEKALVRLREQGVRIHIATNKRAIPTTLILKNLGIWTYFETVYTPDRRSPPFVTKSDLIAAQLAENRFPLKRCCYVGDKFDDGQAAQENGLKFFLASWGYGDKKKCNLPPGWQPISAPDKIFYALMEEPETPGIYPKKVH